MAVSEANETIVKLVKTSLPGGITSTAHDEYFDLLVDDAREMIRKEGITLDDKNRSDQNLLVMYTSYLYRVRNEQTDTAMPRPLRYALNERIFSGGKSDETD